MASLSHAGRLWSLQFVAADKTRRTIRLGKISKRDAETVKHHVETILASAFAGHSPPADTANWLGQLPLALHAKLSAAGLTPSREVATTTTLASFLTTYIAGRNDLKASTVRHLQDSANNLIDYFGEDKPLADITLGDADEFRRHLATTLADNTLRRRCGRAKQFFRAAVRKRLIEVNPFGDMAGCNVQANKAREHFITRDDTAMLFDACPDAQWRLIVALARYGGLRCPSELVGLRLDDVNWDTERVLIRSPKTEHHEGKDERVIPLFPELRPYLEAVWHDAPDGETHFITRYRDPAQNLRTTFLKIIRRAGLVPWPKLFQNLRASRATELANEYPAHVAAAWLGHSTIIAQKHYWQVTEADFSKATIGPAGALQKALHSAPEMGGNERKATSDFAAPEGKTPGKPAKTLVFVNIPVTPTGLEPVLPA